MSMERAVILFDDDCGFCRWSLSKILAWDRLGRLRPVALQSPEADDLLWGSTLSRRWRPGISWRTALREAA